MSTLFGAGLQKEGDATHNSEETKKIARCILGPGGARPIACLVSVRLEAVLMSETLTDPWKARIEARVGEVLESLAETTEAKRAAALLRECPFKKGSRLYAAWWNAVRQVRREAKKEREA